MPVRQGREAGDAVRGEALPVAKGGRGDREAMIDPATQTPFPGSREALDAGCICPVLDNGHGNLSLAQDRGGWWITVGCPIHSPPPSHTRSKGDEACRTH